MPPGKKHEGAMLDVKKKDVFSRAPKHSVRPQSSDSRDISDELVHDLMRTVWIGEAEHVRLARTRTTFDMPERTDEQQYIARRPGNVDTAPNLLIRPAQKSPWTLIPWFLGAFAVIGLLLAVSTQGLRVRNQVVQDGQAAIEHLLQARGAVERFDFAAASDDFSSAYAQFDRARDDLGIFNTRIGTLLARFPGGGSIGTAKNLIAAGEHLALAGGALSNLVSALSESGAILDPTNDGRVSFSSVLLPMQESLTDAREHLARAHNLLEGVNADQVPGDQREEFLQIRQTLPSFLELTERGAAYVRFLETAIAGQGRMTYLILFQNTSELRPTGGFPGSFGVAEFENGRLVSFEADDVYNPDGQITDLIVPPKALQHITPGWGLRDSTWFADFPTSAQKALEMYELGSGRRVDGVLAVTPKIIEGLLAISGPVSMPEYDLVLDQNDFLAKLQVQVEYGLDKKENRPKKIIMELTPVILRKLYQAPAGQWLRVLSVFSEGLKHRDIMMYFPDEQLQAFVRRESFDGGLHQGPEDFLMVNLANVKGGKADVVTDTALGLKTTVGVNGVTHRLTVTRRHDGGRSDYGFYNLRNPAYVRVFVPKDSRLEHIEGNTKQGFRQLVSYANALFDPDLDAVESSAIYDGARDVTIYEESGRTVFGFWLVVEPGETKETQIQWTTPHAYAGTDYALYIQRQPGLEVSGLTWELSVTGSVRLGQSSPALTATNGIWRLSHPLATDLPISVSFE